MERWINAFVAAAALALAIDRFRRAIDGL